MIDPNDDLATAKKPYKVVACMAVFGRIPLLKQTIRRLYTRNGVDKVICAGDENDVRKVCEDAGAKWVQYRNKPLGDKWNAAFREAKQYNPDACLYVGSSDWISDNWLPKMEPHVQEHKLVGVPGMYLLDISAEFGMRTMFWPGYDRRVRDESIGAGRLLSAELMEAIRWMPFDGSKDKSLDRSMIDNCRRKKVSEVMIHNQNLMVLSISTDRWENKHKFWHHETGVLPSQIIVDSHMFISRHFPEAYEIFETHPKPILQ